MFQSRFPNNFVKGLKSDILNQNISLAPAVVSMIFVHVQVVQDQSTKSESQYLTSVRNLFPRKEGITKKNSSPLTSVQQDQPSHQPKPATCSKKFTKLGQYKSHINNDHMVHKAFKSHSEPFSPKHHKRLTSNFKLLVIK